jgi:hypothetical protein
VATPGFATGQVSKSQGLHDVFIDDAIDVPAVLRGSKRDIGAMQCRWLIS